MNQTFLILTILGMVFFGSIYGGLKGKIGNGVLVFKALATLMPVLAAFAGVRANNSMSGWLMVGGAVLCMVADVLLELVLLAGVAVFALAHLLLIAGYACRYGMEWYTLILFATGYLIFFVGLGKYLPEAKKMNRKKMVPDAVYLTGAAIYPAFLCGTAALALSGLIKSGFSLSAIPGAIGGVCFMISDYILAWRTFTKRKERKYSLILLIFYYSAVYLLVC